MTTPAETDTDTLEAARRRVLESAGRIYWREIAESRAAEAILVALREQPALACLDKDQTRLASIVAVEAAAPLLTKAAEDAAYQHGRTDGWDEGYDRGRQDHCDFMPYPGPLGSKSLIAVLRWLNRSCFEAIQ